MRSTGWLGAPGALVVIGLIGWTGCGPVNSTAEGGGPSPAPPDGEARGEGQGWTPKDPGSPWAAPVLGGPQGSPVQRHGKLRVVGAKLVNADGVQVQLRGMALNGIYWFPEYYNSDTIEWLRDDWKVDLVRMAVTPSVFSADPPARTRKAREIIEGCIQAGVYVIIDWHNDVYPDPRVFEEPAKAFFAEMAGAYRSYPHVLYEIANEPQASLSWKDVVRPYMERVISVIRQQDPDAVALVETGNILDYVPAPLGLSNVLYVEHFYAGSVGYEELTARLDRVLLAGLPLFVSEWGVTDWSGSGPIYLDRARRLIDFMAERKIGWANWNLSNKEESTAALVPAARTTGGWGEDSLSPSGRFIRGVLRQGAAPPPPQTPTPTQPGGPTNPVPSQPSPNAEPGPGQPRPIDPLTGCATGGASADASPWIQPLLGALLVLSRRKRRRSRPQRGGRTAG